MKIKKIYLSIFGSGLGHATRIKPIYEILQKEGHIIQASSFGEGFEFLKNDGVNCKRVPEIDVSWKDDGSVSPNRTLLKLPKNIIIFIIHIFLEFILISKFKPDIIISDSRLSSIIVSRIMRIRSITILNQIKIKMPNNKDRKLISVIERFQTRMLVFLWSMSDKIVIPDLPPPYTISKYNMVEEHRINKKLQYIGLIVKKNTGVDSVELIRKMNIEKNKRTIFFQISGPKNSNTEIVKKIKNNLDSISEEYNIIISAGNLGRNNQPKKIGNIWFFEWCDITNELIIESDIIITRGGHSSISKALNFGKPIISIPINNHTEQINNARTVEEMGLGMKLDESDISYRSLKNSIEYILKNDKFKINIEKYLEICDKYNSIQLILEEINN